MTNRKKHIPKALRETVWLRQVGRVFEHKCLVPWCLNTMTVFDFQTGHNIPESRGGKTTVENLVPICSRCNQSMGNQHTIDEWSKLYRDEPRLSGFKRLFGCFFKLKSATVSSAPVVSPAK